MSQVQPYIGDAAFRRFLEAYDCPSTFEAVQLRFLAAIVSPEDIEPGFPGWNRQLLTF
jgi:hypothetical protein